MPIIICVGFLVAGVGLLMNGQEGGIWAIIAGVALAFLLGLAGYHEKMTKG